MKYALIPVIINLLSAVVECQREQRQEVNLINQLNEFFGFDHNIFLLDRKLDPDRFVASVFDYDKFVPKSVYTVDDDWENNNTETTVKNITSKNTLLIVAVENFRNDSRILAEVKNVRKLQVVSNVKIGVFFGRNIVTSMGFVEQLFRWSWSVGIVNIFGAFYKNIDDAALNVFRYDPFDTFELINVTGIESLQNCFHDKVPNYRQHPFTLVKLNEVPLKNVEVQFWDTVVSVFNASKSNTNTSLYNYTKSDMLLHEDILNMNNSGKDIQVYPHRISSIVLLVPHSQPYSGFVAYLQNGTWNLFFAYTFLVVAGAIILLTVSGYMHTKRVMFVQCFIDVINLLMNDNGTIRYGRLHVADVWVIVPLTFTGLIVVNGILSVFQSYLTVPIYERQIKTFDDLFESTVPILSNENSWASRVFKTLDAVTKHGGWKNKVRPVKLALQTEELQKFNSSISATLSDYTARIYLEVQKQLTLKVYYLLDAVLEKNLVIYTPTYDFPFMEAISDIILRLQCAGLMEEWRKDGDQLAIQRLFKMNVNRQSKSINESDSVELIVPTVVWCGWIASAILFAFEIIWNKFNRFQPHIAKLKTMSSWQISKPK